MSNVTIGDLRKYLENYKGADTDVAYGVLTGLPGQQDDELARFVATDLQAHMDRMRMGFFACASLPCAFEEAQELMNNAFYFTTP